MIREQFLTRLAKELSNVPEDRRREWMYDYEEHFRFASADGLTEEQALQELGDPRDIARELLLHYRVKQAESSNTYGAVVRAVFAGVSLSLFNLFFVLAPFVAVSALIANLWIAAAAFGVTGTGIFIAVLIGSNPLFDVGFTFTQGLFVTLTLLSLCVLTGAGMLKLTKWFFAKTLVYLRFNLKMVRRSGAA